MKQQPALETGRLIMRPFTLMDAENLQCLASAREIAATTVSIPHPYPDGAAENWIISHFLECKADSSVTFAITLKGADELLGGISLMDLGNEHKRGELGYWIGVPYWEHGYGSEAAHAVVRYGFETLGLNRIFANCFKNNPASRRILEKIGMTYEGYMRQHVLKWGNYIDIEVFGMLRSDWEKQLS